MVALPIVPGSTPNVSCRSGPTYAYEWSTGVVAETPFTRATLCGRSREAASPGGACTTTSAPSVRFASTFDCLS